MSEETADTAGLLVKALLGAGLPEDRAKLLDKLFKQTGSSSALLRKLQQYYRHHPEWAYKEVDAEGREKPPRPRLGQPPWQAHQRIYQKPEHEKVHGHLDRLVALGAERDENMEQLLQALMFENELRKLGLTREQVSHYIRAENVRLREGGRWKQLAQEDPRAIVGAVDNDGKEHIFQVPILSNTRRIERGQEARDRREKMFKSKQ